MIKGYNSIVPSPFLYSGRLLSLTGNKQCGDSLLEDIIVRCFLRQSAVLTGA